MAAFFGGLVTQPDSPVFETRSFSPPARWAWFYGLAALLTWVALGGAALRAWHARGQQDFALWLTLAVAAALIAPWLVYGWWWTRQIQYRLTRGHVMLRAPGAQAEIPLESIVWAGVEAHYERALPPPPRHWPGTMVGLVASGEGPTVAFYGLRGGVRVILEDADERIFVLTPADEAAFLDTLRGLLEAPSEEASVATEPLPAAGPTAPPDTQPTAAAPKPRAASAPRPASPRVPRGAWAVMGVAWVVSLLAAASAYSVAVLLPLGLQYALYGHLVLLGAETGVGHYLFATGREASAYTLWAAGLLAGLGVTWAVVYHLYL